MPDRVISPEADTRFQFEVVKNLSESIRQIASGMAEMQKTQVGMLERLARIEANSVNREVVELKTGFGDLETRIDDLERERDMRVGASGVGKSLMGYWPAVAMVGAFLYIVLTTIGIIHIPSQQPITVQRETTHTTETQRSDGP